tara:strand:+ start:130 stop:327 length:198 start_codon:yes stop_codon:yes gene_type:complete
MKTNSKKFIVLLILFLSLSLQACKKEEQGRPLSYNKGVYQGNADNSLSGSEVYQLKKRVSGQSWY